MGPIRLVALASLRRHLVATLALTLLIGVAGGAVLAAAAGATRTAAAFPGLLDRSATSDLSVLSDGSVRAQDVEGRHGVLHAGDAIGFGLATEGPEPGIPNLDEGPGALASSDGTVLLERDRPLVLEGRLPDPSQEGEVFVNERSAALYDVAPGDTKRFYLFGFEELSAAFAGIPDPESANSDQLVAALDGVFTPVDLTIVGIGRLPSEVVANENQLGPAMVLTPAFARAHADVAGYRITYIDLRDPRNLSGLQASLAAEHPDRQVGNFQTRESLLATVDEAVGPYHDALVLFAVIGGLTSLIVVGQAMARQVIADAGASPVLGGIGMTRAQVTLATSGRAVLAAVGGAALAAVVSVAASPLFPIGPAQRAQVGWSFGFEPRIVLGGAAVITAVLIARSLATAWRHARSATSGAASMPRQSTTAWALEVASPGTPLSIGARTALSPTDPKARAARTSTIVGLAVAMATILAALTFGASLDRLVATPAAYGWTWDSLLDTYENGVTPELSRLISHDEAISGYTIGARASLTVDALAVAGFGFDPKRGEVLPSVTAGRFPTSAHEVALGAVTMRRLHRSIGDTVDIGPGADGPSRFRIVGRIVIPSLNLDNTYGLADSAALSIDGLTAVVPRSQPSFVLVDFTSPVGPHPIEAATRRYPTVAGSFLGLQRPGEISGYSGVRRTPLVLAGLLAVLGFGVLLHGLLTAVRANRRSLAILKTIGFTRRQVRATVAWHITTVVLVAAVVALPLGVAGGRWAWSLLVERLGIAADPVVPTLALIGFLLGTLLLANLIGAVPARRASHLSPATVLRSE